MAFPKIYMLIQPVTTRLTVPSLVKVAEVVEAAVPASTVARWVILSRSAPTSG